MRVLCTGADGFLGANLCRRLLADGHDVTGAALNRKGFTSLDALGVNVRLEYGDITDRAYVERLVSTYDPQWVFHLAAVSIVKVAATDPYRAIRTNVLGTLNVCQTAKGARVLVASSDKAYGDHGGAAYREEMPLKPTGAYEVSKTQADQIGRLYGAVVTRCANLYGPGDLHWSRLVPGSCRRALRGEPPVIHGGAWHYRREWLDVDSAVDAYLVLAESGERGEAYNVGTGELASAGSLAMQIAGLMGGLEPREGGAIGCYEIPTQALCSDKLRGLGWRPARRFAEALSLTLDWYRSYLGVQVLSRV